MALTPEDLQAIGDLIDGKLEPIKTEIAEIKKNMATKREMRKGFKELKESLDIAASDAARTETRLNEHVQQPHIA